MALTAVISLATANMSFAGGSIGYGDISVYKNGTLVNKLTGQNPIEDGSLLVCDGKCMLKSEGISIVASDMSKVAVENEADTFKLYVKEGSVNYVINSNARKIAFYTPQGTYTVAEVVFNASGTPVVKGQVVVDKDGKTEIIVTEGRMVFATADGMKTVDANKKIVLAQAVVTPGSTSALPFIATGLGFGAVFAASSASSDNDNGTGGTGGGSTGGTEDTGTTTGGGGGGGGGDDADDASPSTP